MFTIFLVPLDSHLVSTLGRIIQLDAFSGHLGNSPRYQEQLHFNLANASTLC